MKDQNAPMNLVINHVEKAVLVLVVGIFGFLVYKGFSMEPFKDGTPGDLASRTQSAQSSLQANHWATIENEEQRIFNAIYSQRTDDVRSTIDPGLNLPVLTPPAGKVNMKRTDPAITNPEYAPKSIEVHGVLGSLLVTKNMQAPISLLELAEEMVIEEPKTRPPRRSRSRSRNRASQMMEEYEDSSMEEEEGGDFGGTLSTLRGPKARTLDPKYNKGFSLSSNTYGRSQTPSVPLTHHFIVGTAVMPNEALSGSFESALAEAAGYDVRRDIPKYLAYRVIRADVTGRAADQIPAPDDALIAAGKGDWKTVTSNDFVSRNYVHNWAGSPGEVIDPKFVDSVLTQPMPPLLLKDYMPFAGHTDIPFIGEEDDDADSAMMADAAGDEAAEAGAPTAVGVGDLNVEALERATKRRSQASTTGGYEDEEGSMYEDEESYGDMEGGMGSTYGGAYGAPVIIPSEYKLIRFYDFRGNPALPGMQNSAQPGRSYIYRIAVAVEDPNYPVNRLMAPKLSTLDTAVLNRLKAKEKEDAVKSKAYGRPYRTGYVWSAWSEPSAVVSLPTANSFAAGGAQEPGKDWNFNGFKFPKDPYRKASIVSAQFSLKYGTEITAQFDGATIGTVLDQPTFDDEIVNPSNLQIVKLPGASVRSGGLLMGIQGGHVLHASPEDAEKPLTAPANLLLFDSKGGLTVRSEIDDAWNYRRFTFAEEREKLEQASSSKANAEAAMMEAEEMMSYGEEEGF